MIEDIILVAHSVCLAHIVQDGTRGERAQPLFSMIVQIYKNVEDDIRGPEGHMLFLPQRERMGMFLQIRISCRVALNFCSSWYQETVKREVALLVRRRETLSRELPLRETLNRTRRAYGCECELCDLNWLYVGWQCPAARFREFLLGGTARAD